MKEYFVEDKRISIYDDIFPLHFRERIYKYATSSLYSIGYGDSLEQDKIGYRFLYSSYSKEDIDNLGYIKELEKTPVISEMEGYHISKVVMKLTSPSDVNFIHTHQESKVLLYYVNLSWQEGWFGETLFYGQNKKDIFFSSAYTPGRLVTFDASIPHTIRPQSILANVYRFTLATVLDLDWVVLPAAFSRDS